MCFFCWIFENNCLGGGVLARFFCPRGRNFALFFVPVGWRIRPFKNIPRGVAQRGFWSVLELTDTLWLSMTKERTSTGFRDPSYGDKWCSLELLVQICNTTLDKFGYVPSVVTAIIVAGRNWTIDYNVGQACDVVIKVFTCIKTPGNRVGNMFPTVLTTKIW